MCRHGLLPIAFAALVLGVPSSSRAQLNTTFVEGLVDLVNAMAGEHGDEGPAVTAAIETMAAGLDRWDEAVARVEAGFASQVGAAPAPAAARMRTALGAVYLDRGRLAAAVEQFRTATELDPTFGDARRLLGVAYQRLNRPLDAARVFQTLWQRDRRSPADGYLFLQSAGDTDSAEASAAIDILFGAIESGAGAPGLSLPAAGFLDESSLTAPVFAPALYAEGFAELGQGRYREAIAALRQSASRDPLVTDGALRSAAMRHASAALRQNDPATAVEEAAAVVKAFPSSSEAHRMLGQSYWRHKEYQRSLDELRRAVQLNPRDERSLVMIGDVLVASGDFGGARLALDGATQAVPGSALSRWKLASVHQEFGDEASALRSLRAATAAPIIGGAPHLYAAIGRLEHGRLDLEAAETAYARRAALAPTDVAAHFDLGEVFRAEGKLRPALVEYLLAAVLDPRSARSVAMVGQVYVASNRDADAVRMLRRAVDLSPDQLEARYALARALLRLGRDEEGRLELQRFQLLQSKALDDQRQQFRDNQKKIDDVLRDADRAEPAR